MAHEIDVQLVLYRKPWYQRAMQVTNLWRSISNNTKSTDISSKNVTSLWRSNNISRPQEINRNHQNNNHNVKQLRKCSSLRVSTCNSFTRVCLCAPISSYNKVFRVDYHHHNQIVPPQRSNSYPRMSKSLITPQQDINGNNNNSNNSITTRVSMDRRRVFHGNSLKNDTLMKRFVIEEEEEAMMQIRRRNQMVMIRKRSSLMRRKKKLGPSPLSRMVLAEECMDDEQEIHQIQI